MVYSANNELFNSDNVADIKLVFEFFKDLSYKLVADRRVPVSLEKHKHRLYYIPPKSRSKQLSWLSARLHLLLSHHHLL